MREVEAKFRVGDVEALLLALKARGVELAPSVVQDDQAYALGGWRYGQSKIGVPFARLRTEVGRHVFTVKVPDDNELSCEEHETEVSDREQMHAAVVAMGFTPTVRIVKTRRRGLSDHVATLTCRYLARLSGQRSRRRDREEVGRPSRRRRSGRGRAGAAGQGAGCCC